MTKKLLCAYVAKLPEMFLNSGDGGFLSRGRHEDEVFEGDCRLEEVMGELVFLQDFLSIFEVARWFPCVVTNGVSFPLDEIAVSSTPFLVTCDSFYFIFLFSFNKVRRWFYKVRTMGFSFTIR